MAAPTPTPVTLVGATGLTGSATLSALLSSTHPFTIRTIGRKAIPPQPAQNTSTTFTHTLLEDMFEAPSMQVGEKGGVYVSCLGTTRAAAGGNEAQEKVDLVLNRDLAQRAKEDGVNTLILVSSAGTSADSSIPYGRMKGTLENDVKAMDFQSCVILRPGLLLGPRTESRPPERAFQILFSGLKSIGLPMGRFSAEGEDIGACIAYYAANPPSEKVTVVDNVQIAKMAKEYKKVFI